MSPLPDSYLSPLHLPFNRTALAGSLVLEPPDTPASEDPCWLLLRGGELLVASAGGGCSLPQGEALPAGVVLSAPPLHLGRWQGRPCRLAPVSRQVEIPPGLTAQSLMAAEPQLPIDLLSLGALGGQVLHWEKRSQHCSACGGVLDRLPGEWGKRCPGCGAEHFPHIHPCVIVAVTRPGEILLARKPGWPEGRYGLVAGFVDFAEALEEAVVREVLEETGVRVENVRYVGSQAWPFPSQLMAGFVATYAEGEIRVDTRELEDARWFPRNDLPQLPPKRSIARYLIDHLAGE